MTDRQPIAYADRSLPAPPAVELFYVAVAGWAIAAAVGVGCLLGYAVTWRPFFLLAGFAWLPVGGIITLVAFLCGRSYAAKSKSCNHSPPHTSRRATLAVYLPASNAILAILCGIAGVFLFVIAPTYFVVRLTNPTPERVDAAAIVFGDGTTVAIGPIRPNEAKSKKVKLAASGRLLLRVRQGDREWDQVAMDYIDEDEVRDVSIKDFIIAVPPQVP